MVAANDDLLIKAAVTSGQRPDLYAITGPDTLVMLIKDCIMRFWHQSPESRPSFAGNCWYSDCIL